MSLNYETANCQFLIPIDSRIPKYSKSKFANYETKICRSSNKETFWELETPTRRFLALIQSRIPSDSLWGKKFCPFFAKCCPKYCCHQLISRLIQVRNNLLRFPLLWNKIFLSLSKMLPVIPRSTFWGSELTTDRIPLGSMMRKFLPIFGSIKP